MTQAGLSYAQRDNCFVRVSDPIRAHALLDEQRRQPAAVTRKLALLRAHGLIKRVPGTHRWVLTESGRRIVAALLAARHADVDQLTQLAAYSIYKILSKMRDPPIQKCRRRKNEWAIF